MNEMDYNNADGIRRSDLWKMEDSPEKFRWFLDHPMEQTPAMAFGTACHKMILEPKDFSNEFVVAPQVDKRTKAGKEEWEAFCIENAGKTIISAEDEKTMREMAEAVENNQLAKKLLRGKGQTEQAFFWTDPITKERCKIKCDRVVTINRRKYILDYKTTQNADTKHFNMDMFKLGYHFQAGMYSEGVMRAKRMRNRPGFIFVAQEKKPPYSINVILVTEDVMNAGISKFHELLEKMHDCKELDVWPGYMGIDNEMNETQLPAWMAMADEEL